jgi:hypothetical protein
MPLAEVARAATRIVHAKVVGVRAGRDESGLPATWVTVKVARTLKGLRARRLTLKQYGVATPLADGTITGPAGLPRYRTGEEIVLFLRAESRLGFTSPVGFAQGKYRVRRERGRRRVGRELRGAPMRDLDDFLAEVQGLAGPIP